MPDHTNRPAANATTANSTVRASNDLLVTNGMLQSPLSEPEADACDHTGVVDIVARGATEIGRSPERAFARDPDVRRELSRDFVAQAQSGFDRAQSRTDPAAGIVLAPNFRFGKPLQHQPVGQQRVVLDFHAQARLPTLADVGGRFHFELLWREPDHADRGERLRGTFSGIVADTDDPVPPA